MQPTLEILTEVNHQINEYPYLPDVKEEWNSIVETGGGDCEDYAIAKFEKLVHLGISSSLLRLAVCTVEGGGHCVVLVNIGDQVYMLDNRYPHPVPLELVEYEFVKVQVAGTSEWRLP